MVKYALYITTYDRGTYHTGHTKPYHWAFRILRSVPGSGHFDFVHQLRGMPGNFHYVGPEKVEVLAEFGTPKQTLEVGELDESNMVRVHGILKALCIDQAESSRWNCQNWILEGLERLMREGFVYDYMTKDAVKNWLKEQ